MTRSRKEDAEAYGRTFTGCGMQSDYDEIVRRDVRVRSRNIFRSGCRFPTISSEIHKANHKTTGVVVALKHILMPHEKRHANDRPTRD